MCVTQLILRVKESMLLLVKVKRRESESECGSIADLGWCLRKDSSLKISGKGCECLISSDICPISIKTHPEWNEERVSDTWKEKWFSPKLTKSNRMWSLKQLLKQQKLCECFNGAICSPPSLLMCVTYFVLLLMISDQTKLHIEKSDILVKLHLLPNQSRFMKLFYFLSKFNSFKPFNDWLTNEH